MCNARDKELESVQDNTGDPNVGLLPCGAGECKRFLKEDMAESMAGSLKEMAGVIMQGS